MSDAVNPDHYKRLPAEAIEIIEAMIAGAPDNKAAYLHGQGAKYDLRLWGKGKSLEDYLTDWQKHIWYALRLESHLLELIEKQKADEQQKASDLQSLKDHQFGKLKEPVIKQSLTTEPPDGWRWLEVGETLHKGDTTNTIDEIPEDWIGIKCAVKHNLLRRNRFEVGEKVVECVNNRIGVVKDIEAIGSGKNFLCHVEMQDTKCMVVFSPHQLAPYIEEAK